MNRIYYGNRGAMAVETGGELTELVRGQEDKLVERLAPLVRSQSVLLDMGQVERIDAAGIAALISIYRLAAEAGHRFTVANPRPRVEEILALVGLDRILASQDVEDVPHPFLRLELTAA
jgi:anti-anti-sigma factor